MLQRITTIPRNGLAKDWRVARALGEEISETGNLCVSKTGWSGWWFGTWILLTCLIFPYIGNNDPNWLSYFSYDFPFSWEFHDPNWRTHIFQRVGKNHQPDGTVPRCLALSKHLKVLRHELCACGAWESVTARWIATSKKAALMGIPSDRKPSRIWVNQWIHQFQGYSYNVWHGNGMFGNYVNYNLQVYVNLSTWEWINTYLYHF